MNPPVNQTKCRNTFQNPGVPKGCEASGRSGLHVTGDNDQFAVTARFERCKFHSQDSRQLSLSQCLRTAADECEHDEHQGAADQERCGESMKSVIG